MSDGLLSLVPLTDSLRDVSAWFPRFVVGVDGLPTNGIVSVELLAVVGGVIIT